MRLTWIPFGFDYRPALAGLALAVAFVLGSVSPSFAQAATPPQQPAAAAQQAPAKPAISFQNDAGLIILYIKPDKAADFEDLMNKLKEGLAKMDAPEAKQQAASLKLFKSSPVPAGSPVAAYFILADPVVKNIEYWFLPILYKAYPNDGQALLLKWTDSKAATPAPTIFDLALVMKMQ